MPNFIGGFNPFANSCEKILTTAFGLLAAITFTGCSTTGKTENQPAVVSFFDGQTLNGWIDQENGGTNSRWTVTNGVIASTGAGRGTLYTKADYSHFRLTFLMRHVSGKTDHQSCVLIFCRRPKDGEKPLDALGGIQFQVRNGGHWDYRPGQNRGGGAEFTTPVKTKFDNGQWSRVEILADASKGTARMAVAQPPGSKAVENLDFNVPEAGRIGPIALQMHNGGLLDEYKDIAIEVDPKLDDLITTK